MRLLRFLLLVALLAGFAAPALHAQDDPQPGEENAQTSGDEFAAPTAAPANDEAQPITRSVESSTLRPVGEQAVQDPTIAAKRFVEHVNYARVAAAMRDGKLVAKHLDLAEALLAVLRDATVEQRRVPRVESGRIIYDYAEPSKNHYFPVETGPMEMESAKAGPFWSPSKGVAVTDAEMVYVTVDLSGNKAGPLLADARAALKKENYSRVQSRLAKLTSSVVKVDKKVELPLAKARDNLALAHQLILAQDYKAARFPIKHADKALRQLERDPAYASRQSDITAMRHDLADMQETLRTNAPSLTQKAGATLDKWWSTLKGWGE